MRIMGADPSAMRGMSRLHRLRADLEPSMIQTVLNAMAPTGMRAEDLGPSRDGRATHQWCFYADGHEMACSIWDHDGVRWSAYGPRDVFEELGWLQ